MVLGVNLDSLLHFSDHINYVCRKLSSLSGLLWRIREFVLEKKQTYYNSYCLPLMDYCINIWGHCNKTQLEIIKEYFVYKTEFYVLCQVIMFVMEGYCLINMIIL